MYFRPVSLCQAGKSTFWKTIDRFHTDFWGPVSNFGIPIAAVMDTQKDPEMYAVC